MSNKIELSNILGKFKKKPKERIVNLEKDKDRKQTLENLLPFDGFVGELLQLNRSKLSGSFAAAFRVSSTEVDNAQDDILNVLLSDFEILMEKSFYLTQISQYNFRATEKAYIEDKKRLLDNAKSDMAYEWIKTDLEFDQEVLFERYSFEAEYVFVIRYDYLPTSNLDEDIKKAKRRFDLFESSSNRLFKKHSINFKRLNRNEYSELLYYVINPEMKGKQCINLDDVFVKGLNINNEKRDKSKIEFDINDADNENTFDMDGTVESTVLRKSYLSLKNKLVPYSIKKLDDCLLVGDSYQVVYEVHNLPTHLKAFWQKELAMHVGNIDITYFFKSLKTDEVVKELDKLNEFSRVNLEDSKGKDQTHRHNIKVMAKQAENINNVFDNFQEGQRLFNFSMYIRVRAKTYEQLLSECDDVENILGSTLCNFRKTIDNYVNGVISILPLATDKLKTNLPMLTQGVGNTFPLVNHSFSDPNGEIFGINKSNETIVKYTNDSDLYNNGMVLVTGISGAGKSVTAKKVVKNNVVYRDHKLFVIDPDNECRPLCNSINGDYNDIHSGSNVRINILEPFDDPEVDSIIEPTVNSSSSHIRGALKLDDEDAFKVQYLINVLLREAGYTNDKASLYTYSNVKGDIVLLEDDKFKTKRKAPILSDLKKLAEENRFEEFIGETKKLSSKLSLLCEGGVFPLFDGQTNVDFLNNLFWGFKRCDKNYKEVSIGVVNELFWRLKMKYMDIDMTLYYEEVHYALRNDTIGESVYDYAKRLRKYNGYPIFATQNMSDLLQSKWGEAILTNAATLILMKQSMKDAKEITNQVDTLKTSHIQKMIQMDQGECLLVLNGTRVINAQVIVSEKELEVFKTSEV